MSNQDHSTLFSAWIPDPLSELLKTGYRRFETRIGIQGLARMDNERGLDILAVVSSRPGEGKFRQFIATAQQSFDRVAVWVDFNPLVGKALRRYGFVRAQCTEPDGEVCQGWQWRRQ